MSSKPTYEELELKIKKLPKTKEELKRKITELNSFINNVPAMAWLKDTDSRFIAVNREFGEAVGMNPESLINQTCEVCFGKEEAKKFREDDQEVMKSTRRVIIEEKITDSQTNEIWLETIKSPIFDESGKVLGTVGMARDITDRKLAEGELRESEERYRTLVEAMGEGLGVADENGLITYINDRLSAMIGYLQDETIGRSIYDFIEETNHELVKEIIGKRKRGESGPYELVLKRKDNQKVHAIMSSRPIFDAKGQFKGSFGVLTDITERKEMEEKLQKAYDELEQRVEERTRELEIKTDRLEEANIALNFLLYKIKEDKINIEKNITSNMNKLVYPYLDKAKKNALDDIQKTYLELLESNLNEIISPFTHKLSAIYTNLTPAEIQVADFVKHGKSTKEIANLLSLSVKTIDSHRESIRKKMGIKNKKVNLRSLLLSLQ